MLLLKLGYRNLYNPFVRLRHYEGQSRGNLIPVEDIQLGYEHLKAEMSFDRTKHKILPPSKFGLVQITRQRVRPELVIKTQEPNPSGSGEVEAPIVLLDTINAELDKLIDSKEHKKIILNVHPFIAAYLTKGISSIQLGWFTKYKKWIKILPRDAYQYLRFDFTNNKGELIK